MAFGIDDALAAAAAGVSLTETIVEVVKRYRKQNPGGDLELLLAEVRSTAVAKINDADLALTQFERMLLDRDIDVNEHLIPTGLDFDTRPIAVSDGTNAFWIFDQEVPRGFARCDDRLVTVPD